MQIVSLDALMACQTSSRRRNMVRDDEILPYLFLMVAGINLFPSPVPPSESTSYIPSRVALAAALPGRSMTLRG